MHIGYGTRRKRRARHRCDHARCDWTGWKRLYEALKHLSAADVADLTTSDGQAYVVGAMSP